MVMDWVAKKPDDHLRCWGLRWCGSCGEVAHYVAGGTGRCPFCEKRYTAASRARIGRRRPKATPAQLAASRRYNAHLRRTRDQRYLDDLERRRAKYATDPVYAERKRRAAAEAYARAHPEPARDGRATLARAARGTLRGRVHETSASMARGQAAAA